jgi:hypothetical protein
MPWLNPKTFKFNVTVVTYTNVITPFSYVVGSGLKLMPLPVFKYFPEGFAKSKGMKLRGTTVQIAELQSPLDTTTLAPIDPQYFSFIDSSLHSMEVRADTEPYLSTFTLVLTDTLDTWP